MVVAFFRDRLVENCKSSDQCSRPKNSGCLTGPELVFVFEVISNLVVHAMNSCMSSLRVSVLGGIERIANARASRGKER